MIKAYKKDEKMKKTLISSEKKQYKANLHCHSTLSDGKLAPEELKKMYKEHGYDILAITDHSHPYNHSAMNDPGFLMLTGYEAYIRESGGPYDTFKREIHLNLFAKEPDNTALVCYDPRYTKYIPAEKHGELCRAGDERQREFTVEYINEFIKTAIDNGYLVAYNHPFWSMDDEARILSYKNLLSLELYNTGSYIANNIENAEMLYDVMLRHGIHLGCHAGDDNHNSKPLDSPYSDSFGFFTMILADSLEYSAVIKALEEKNFYASSGPRIDEIRIVNDEEKGKLVRVKCSPATKIFMYFGSKSPRHIRLPKGECAESFDLTLPADAKYVRISVYDADGNVANSRGFFPEEWDG